MRTGERQEGDIEKLAFYMRWYCRDKHIGRFQQGRSGGYRHSRLPIITEGFIHRFFGARRNVTVTGFGDALVSLNGAR